MKYQPIYRAIPKMTLKYSVNDLAGLTEIDLVLFDYEKVGIGKEDLFALQPPSLSLVKSFCLVCELQNFLKELAPELLDRIDLQIS
jgi:hypothetical protein